MIRVGTDCSGIEAPIQALKNLGVPFSHEFSSDIDKYCIQSIKANYKPKVLFGDPDGSFPCGDIAKRDIKDVPDIDLYVCGFPCQPFSSAGHRTGFVHESGNVFWSCLEVIKVKKPKYFILENVKGLLSNDKGKTWKTIWEALNKLQGYAIDWRILNTKDYGIPQNRERLFIVGKRGGKYTWPMPSGLKEATALSEMVEKGLPSRVPPPYIKKVISANPGTRCIFFNPGFRKIWPSNEHVCPCITAAGPRFWCVPESRDISSKEMMRLQGFPTDFIQVVSEKQMKKQLGNSMSVNVIEKIIKSLFY